jgi:hypothetical protein
MKFAVGGEQPVYGGGDFKTREYENLGDADINLAVVDVNGRYPAENFTSNAAVQELLFITAGAGEYHGKDGAAQKFTAGDALLIAENEAYFFTGKFTAAITCAPAWTLAQTKEVK